MIVSKLRMLALVLASIPPSTGLAAQVDDAAAVALAAPEQLIVDGTMPDARRAEILKPVDAFYGFWTNGSAALLEAALAPTFEDHTLPPGRPQGPSGPAVASAAFLAALPDLECKVVQRIVTGERVITHMRFTGHFTGTFDGAQGRGQVVDFVATDILRVHDGKITNNWHIEDNLTFLRQIGRLPPQ